MEEQLKRIVIATLKIRESDYSEDLAAGDIPEWDSIGHVNLLMAVEREYGIVFDVTDSIEIETISDLEDMIRKYVAMKSGS